MVPQRRRFMHVHVMSRNGYIAYGPKTLIHTSELRRCGAAIPHSYQVRSKLRQLIYWVTQAEVVMAAKGRNRTLMDTRRYVGTDEG